MLKRTVLLKTLLLVSFTFAHVKPFPHTHVGFLHPEEVVVILGSALALGVAGFLLYRRVKGGV